VHGLDLAITLDISNYARRRERHADYEDGHKNDDAEKDVASLAGLSGVASVLSGRSGIPDWIEASHFSS
jgi:hypothetical protein